MSKKKTTKLKPEGRIGERFEPIPVTPRSMVAMLDCDDTQIDIFRETAARIKKIPGASIAWWWWLRSAYGNGSFSYVRTDGSYGNTYADTEGGVAVGFCIETRK